MVTIEEGSEATALSRPTTAHGVEASLSQETNSQNSDENSLLI
jgi:hypothetical protein